jgi:pyruvate/2-oxoglutarate/acetoin dehydrogenase E1 component
MPLDGALVLESLARTSRLLVLQEAPRSSGVAGQILSLVAREGFELLDAPPAVVAPPDTPVPFAPELEDAALPSVEKVRAAVEELLAY